MITVIEDTKKEWMDEFDSKIASMEACRKPSWAAEQFVDPERIKGFIQKVLVEAREKARKEGEPIMVMQFLSLGTRYKNKFYGTDQFTIPGRKLNKFLEEVCGFPAEKNKKKGRKEKLPS